MFDLFAYDALPCELIYGIHGILPRAHKAGCDTHLMGFCLRAEGSRWGIERRDNDIDTCKIDKGAGARFGKLNKAT